MRRLNMLMLLLAIHGCAAAPPGPRRSTLYSTPSRPAVPYLPAPSAADCDDEDMGWMGRPYTGVGTIRREWIATRTGQQALYYLDTSGGSLQLLTVGPETPLAGAVGRQAAVSGCVDGGKVAVFEVR